MPKIEAPEGIEIRRDLEGEKLNPRHTYYKMYFNDDEIGVANYRTFMTTPPYWYIDKFLVLESHRGNGYGTYFLDYIVKKMWNEHRFRIDIYPTGDDEYKPKFVDWLTRRGFVKLAPMPQGQLIMALEP